MFFCFLFAKLQEQEEAEKELMADERETALKNMREKFSSDMEEEKNKLAEEQKEALEELREKLEKEKETVSHFKEQGLVPGLFATFVARKSTCRELQIGRDLFSALM